MRTMFVVGITARNGGRRGDNPLRHAYTLRPASRTGRNVLARCGTSILPTPLHEDGHQVPFDTEHPRSCRRCRAMFRAR